MFFVETWIRKKTIYAKYKITPPVFDRILLEIGHPVKGPIQKKRIKDIIRAIMKHNAELTSGPTKQQLCEQHGVSASVLYTALSRIGHPIKGPLQMKRLEDIERAVEARKAELAQKIEAKPRSEPPFPLVKDLRFGSEEMVAALEKAEMLRSNMGYYKDKIREELVAGRVPGRLYGELKPINEEFTMLRDALGESTSVLKPELTQKQKEWLARIYHILGHDAQE